jgi:hypothetical protein
MKLPAVLDGDAQAGEGRDRVDFTWTDAMIVSVSTPKK